MSNRLQTELARYWSKIADFNLPNLHLALLFERTHRNLPEVFSCQQNSSPSRGVVCVLRDHIFSRFDGTPTCDGQTNGQADAEQVYGINRASIASRGKNDKSLHVAHEFQLLTCCNQNITYYRCLLVLSTDL